MSDHSSHSVTVIDNGLFAELAVTLAESFGKVRYWTPRSPAANPNSNSLLIGKGAEGVERVEDYWDYEHKTDLWVFPDIYDGGLQMHLQDLGYRVWGSRKGDELELDREASKDHFRQLDLPIGKWEPVIGMAALREYLQAHDNVWVKVSYYRGDFETFRSKNYRGIKSHIDDIELKLGANSTRSRFLVEEDIPDAVEIGYDGYTVDGKFPTCALIGLEVKSKGYLGHFTTENRMPEQIACINAKLSPTLAAFEYKNFLAVEARITKDGTPWIIDPCCRMGSPPGELCMVMYTNLADIMWEGAHSECIDPVPENEWGAETIIHCPPADKKWQPIYFPPEIRRNVKLRNFSVIDGGYNVMPQGLGLDQVGAVVATGKTPKEAMDRCTEYCDQIEGYGIDHEKTCLATATEQIAKLQEYGITL